MKQFPRLGQRNSAATDMPVLPSLTLLLAIMTTCLAPTVDGGEARPALETSVDASEQTADDLAEDGDNGDDDAKAEKERPFGHSWAFASLKPGRGAAGV